MLCAAQLGFRSKPSVLLNVGRFFHHRIEFLDHATHQGLISAPNRTLVVEAMSVYEALVKAGLVTSVAAPKSMHI
jgi:predicted Rossmann-fold nucleotide-binding protein